MAPKKGPRGASTNGTSAIDRVRKGFTSRRRHLVVTGWDDLGIWCSPVTALDIEKLSARNPANGAEEKAYLIIDKAEDESGSQLFNVRDVKDLIRTEFATLNEVAEFILGPTMTTEAAAAEVEGNPTSASN